MTNIEKTLMMRTHREFILNKMILNMYRELESYIDSRIEDRYYSDSWEQSAQISKDIQSQEKKLCFLRSIKVNTLNLVEITKLKQMKKNLFR